MSRATTLLMNAGFGINRLIVLVSIKGVKIVRMMRKVERYCFLFKPGPLTVYFGPLGPDVGETTATTGIGPVKITIDLLVTPILPFLYLFPIMP